MSRLTSLTFILITLLSITTSITIPVSSTQQKCMIVSSNNQEQMLKVDLKFERFDTQTIQEGYRVVLHNTETHQEEAFQVYQGVFRKEFSLTENVVYRLCFKIVLSSRRPITKNIEYNAGVRHRFSIHDTQITIPQNLLKTRDMTQTYSFLVRMQQLLQKLKQQKQKVKQQDNQTFEGQSSQITTFQWVSIVECVVIVGLGIYQYIQLGNIIQRKSGY